MRKKMSDRDKAHAVLLGLAGFNIGDRVRVINFGPSDYLLEVTGVVVAIVQPERHYSANDANGLREDLLEVLVTEPGSTWKSWHWASQVRLV
jgi:hypothetical protein